MNFSDIRIKARAVLLAGVMVFAVLISGVTCFSSSSDTLDDINALDLFSG